jgi:hypothetical protein
MTRRLAFAVVAAGLLTTAARGQDPVLFLGETPPPAGGPVKDVPAVKNVLLRPNAGVPFYAYVSNPSQTDRTVTALLLTAAGAEIARADNVFVPLGKTVPVLFKGDDKPRAVAAGQPLRLQLLDEKKQAIPAADADVQNPRLLFARPSDYTQATAAFEGRADGTNELRVNFSVRPGAVSGPPVKVKLDLSRVPLAPGSVKDGAFSAEVPAAGGSAVLVARNLKFDGPPRVSWVAVTVDDYERAWLFETAFDGTTPQRPKEQNVVRIVAPPYSVPTDKFPVKIEVDQPSTDANLYVDFVFDKFGPSPFRRAETDKIPVESQTLPGDRRRDATLRAGGPDGAVVFASAVKDWAFDLNASGVLGPRTLLARLMSRKGEKPDPANDTELGHKDVQVIFDDSPPVVKLTAPADQVRGTPMRVTVSAVDDESGIDRVLVFVNDPPAADVRGPVRGKVFLAEPGTTAGTYTTMLAMPDTKGPATVGARVINRVGLVTDAAPVSVMLVDPKVPPKPPTTGAIKGVVEQGSPPRRQPAKPVYLLDEKQSAVVKSAQTNDKGEFAFNDLPPGNYVVRSDKPTDYSTGTKPAAVEAGKTTEVAIDLKRAKPPSPVKR